MIFDVAIHTDDSSTCDVSISKRIFSYAEKKKKYGKLAKNTFSGICKFSYNMAQIWRIRSILYLGVSHFNNITFLLGRPQPSSWAVFEDSASSGITHFYFKC